MNVMFSVLGDGREMDLHGISFNGTNQLSTCL